MVVMLNVKQNKKYKQTNSTQGLIRFIDVYGTPILQP